MVNRSELYLLPLVFLLIQCVAEPPTGPKVDISKKLTLNCVLNPNTTTQEIYLSRWYSCSEYSFNEDCTPTRYDEWSVTGAQIVVTNGKKQYPVKEISLDSIYDEYHRDYTVYYRFEAPTIRPGDVWEIQASHPDLDPIEASTIVPDSVKFTYLPPEILDTSKPIIEYSWTKANNAFGYLTQLYFVGEYVNGHNEMELAPYFDFQNLTSSESTPSTLHSVEYSTENILKQIPFFWRELSWKWGNVDNYDQFYIILAVTSLNEPLYYIQRYHYKPDEFSSFTAPMQIFSNVKNGGGIFGALWTTYSKKVAIPKDVVIKLFEDS